MRGCEDEKGRCEEEKMWGRENVKMRRCEDEKMWRWEDVRMRRCEDERMWRWEDEIQTPTIGRTLRSDALGKNMFPFRAIALLKRNRLKAFSKGVRIGDAGARLKTVGWCPFVAPCWLELVFSFQFSDKACPDLAWQQEPNGIASVIQKQSRKMTSFGTAGCHDLFCGRLSSLFPLCCSLDSPQTARRRAGSWHRPREMLGNSPRDAASEAAPRRRLTWKGSAKY